MQGMVHLSWVHTRHGYADNIYGTTGAEYYHDPKRHASRLYLPVAASIVPN